MSAEPAAASGEVTLKRTLTLWDLVFYGIVIIQPTAPMGLYGVVSKEARGHVVTTILIGLVGMLLTAISYGRCATRRSCWPPRSPHAPRWPAIRG